MAQKNVKPATSQSDGMLSDGTDAGFWRDWLSQKEIDDLPGERKKPTKPDSLKTSERTRR